ncbi:hypothetical protein [Oscillatoria sp. FACHB-1406]|uniref:hypothetical protein n=1 Tax=Oscillatoria sp. FACHB-1406 TaxID=2692846 RepID=UPI0016846D48|nr:hypothetical protein [Oscillatoria sp. FACHB-1406]MBD2576294.1 hypothetical protein [Oscillatoria sp. FACHB-1406]
MKTIEGLSYRDWQKRNKQYFDALSKEQQKDARRQGYNNRGWKQIKRAWRIVRKFNQNVKSLFEYKLDRGDLVGAIDISLLEAERAKAVAKTTLKELEKRQKELDQIADRALKKYVPL